MLRVLALMYTCIRFLTLCCSVYCNRDVIKIKNKIFNKYLVFIFTQCPTTTVNTEYPFDCVSAAYGVFNTFFNLLELKSFKKILIRKSELLAMHRLIINITYQYIEKPIAYILHTFILSFTLM